LVRGPLRALSIRLDVGAPLIVTVNAPVVLTVNVILLALLMLRPALL
jgi:hypothetical protein